MVELEKDAITAAGQPEQRRSIKFAADCDGSETPADIWKKSLTTSGLLKPKEACEGVSAATKYRSEDSDDNDEWQFFDDGGQGLNQGKTGAEQTATSTETFRMTVTVTGAMSHVYSAVTESMYPSVDDGEEIDTHRTDRSSIEDAYDAFESIRSTLRNQFHAPSIHSLLDNEADDESQESVDSDTEIAPASTEPTRLQRFSVSTDDGDASIFPTPPVGTCCISASAWLENGSKDCNGNAESVEHADVPSQSKQSPRGFRPSRAVRLSEESWLARQMRMFNAHMCCQSRGR